ncbi:hypothetical protein V498_06740 [Pseudogymnoascus sp. VKM F-4517 (FW-2822)]|nr:hypothetical protein V498_06740 [Pseudogymnoascus sp. VKM F-4517 (FW-2822)]
MRGDRPYLGITCKRRHLKCDEATPDCGPCSKSRQACHYATSTQMQGSLQTGQESADAHSPSASQWNSRYPDPDREQAASGLLRLTAEAAAASSSAPVEATSPPTETPYSQLSIQEQFEADTQLALTPPDAAFSRWFNLLASDLTSEKAGGTRLWTSLTGVPETSAPETSAIDTVDSLHLPVSSHQTSTDNLIVQDVALLVPPVPNTSAPFPPTAPYTKPLDQETWQGSQPAKLSDKEHDLFENFVIKLSAWIDLYDPKRCFAILVPHLAMHDAGLMNAILALSARQLSININATEEQQDRNIGLQYYYETLHYVQQAMHYDSYTVSPELLATALIISTYEMLDDFRSGWERHLKGVFWIQRSQVIHGDSGGLKQAIWWAWLRQDIWAAFRERRKTLSFWTPAKPYADMTSYEVATRILWIFARVVDYCSEESIQAGEGNLQLRIDKAGRIFEMLDEWQNNLSVEFAPLAGRKGKPSDVFEPIWIHPPAFGNSMQVYCAGRILILLHKPSLKGMREYMANQKLLAKAVDTVCGIAMTLTDDASSLVSSQCLYIATMAPPPDWKLSNKSNRVLAAADKGKYGVIAAIAYNIEHIIGFIKAAEVAKSPIIIQFFPWAVTYSSGLLIRTAADAISRSPLRDHIVLHMDHAQDYNLIKECADQLPFDSIMVDMSHYEKEENLRKTRELVAYCQEKCIATEAEPGRIEGGEDGVMDTEGLEGSKTTPEEVDEFVATGVDALAPAFGNMHGEYWSIGPQLDFLRLGQIRDNINGRVRIALHGTNGFEEDLLRKCIAEGCSKINVNRMVLDDYYDHLKANAPTMSQTQLMTEGTQKVVDLTVKWMEHRIFAPATSKGNLGVNQGGKQIN